MASKYSLTRMKSVDSAISGSWARWVMRGIYTI
jgi:hypothetical protein